MLPYVLFFLSGAVTLIYEVAWVRAVTLEFGSDTLAVSTVVSTFMGGLALGAWQGGRRADRMLRPLYAYGLLELIIGSYAALTPLLLPGVLGLTGKLSVAFASNFWVLSMVRLVTSALVLLPPTVLMGATLPILASGRARCMADGGRGAGLLYGVNTLGALLGTVVAGFALLPSLGLTWSLFVTALVNLALGAVALTAGRREPVVPARSADPPPGVDERPDSSALAAVALTGFGAMACQVLWTRVLSIVLGSSIYIFSVVLALFLGALGLGAAASAGFLKLSPAKSRLFFSGIALGSALLVVLSTIQFSVIPELLGRWFVSWDLKSRFDRVLLAQVLLAMMVIAPPVLLMGGLFPAALRVGIGPSGKAGRNVAGLYAWNTVGAILGALAASFVLVPLLGIRGAVGAAVLALCGGAAAMAYRGTGPRAGPLVATLAGLMAVGSSMFMPSWDRQVLTSGMFEQAERLSKTPWGKLAERLRFEDELLFYRDGLVATVTVIRIRGTVPRHLSISTNGKVDGSNSADMSTQRMLAHVPLLIHPAPRDVCVVGLGTGSTAGSAALHPVERVTVVEIEQAMVDGARHFAAENHRVHENPKVEIRVMDGRQFLALHPRAFDVVVSEPSNPWMAGCADLFTAEFFRRGAGALREGGLFCQWIQHYGLSMENVRLLIRTFLSAFPHAYVAVPHRTSDLLLVGSVDPFPLEYGRLKAALAQRPAVANDLADDRVQVRSIHDFLGSFQMGPSEVRALAGEGEINTDALPLIAYRAPRDQYRDIRPENRTMLEQLSKGVSGALVDLPHDAAGRRELFLSLAASYARRHPAGKAAEECRRRAEAEREP